MECLDETDKRVLISEQKKVPPLLSASAEFKLKHQAKAKAVLKQGGGKAAGKRKKARTKALFRDNYFESFDISQDEGKQYAPPGGGCVGCTHWKAGMVWPLPTHAKMQQDFW